MLNFGLISYLLAACAFLSLLIGCLRVSTEKGGIEKYLVVAAVTLTAVWAFVSAVASAVDVWWILLAQSLELLKTATSYAMLVSFIAVPGNWTLTSKFNKGLLYPAIAVLSALVPAFYLVYKFIGFASLLDTAEAEGVRLIIAELYQRPYLLSFYMLYSILGLVLLEQIVRNTRFTHRWHLKYLCMGMGVISCFELYMYSEALLLGRINVQLWQLRGGVYALSAIFFWISLRRVRGSAIQVNFSRKIVFHTGMMLVSGLYLLLMSSIGFYIRNYSGTWGGALQILFWTASAALLVVLLSSERFRGHVRFYITRNLFSTKYDYREEWLRISKTLSASGSENTLPERVVMALAESVDSAGGGLWLTRDGQNLDQVAQIDFEWVANSSVNVSSKFACFLRDKKWIIEINGDDEESSAAEMPEWLLSLRRAWAVIPLLMDEKLLGFIVLRHPMVERSLNWEDLDLLKTAAQQAASYLGQMVATEALSEARQFSAFNQMAAFVVHDLKTLNSQLSLMVANAPRYKSNPSFIEDMITTCAHVVSKLNSLLSHFRQNLAEKNNATSAEMIEARVLLEKLIASKRSLKPIPELTVVDGDIQLRCGVSELTAALGHILQNAQEATDDEGSINVTLEKSGNFALIRIEDTGEGMSDEFIQTKLFKPFVSTKGLTGMGIGAYQSREYVRSLGGDISVVSREGHGTLFTVSIPLA